MASTVAIIAGAIIAIIYVSLRFLLYCTQDAREPPAIETDQYRLPIYTLRLPFQRIYVVNSTGLIPELQKQWRSVSFAAIAAAAGSVVGMSKDALRIMHQDLTSEHGFSVSWPHFIAPSMAPGKELDAITRRSVEVLSAEMESMRTQGGPVRTGLWAWSRQIMEAATTEAVWGPQNPYRDAGIAKAWRHASSSPPPCSNTCGTVATKLPREWSASVMSITMAYLVWVRTTLRAGELGNAFAVLSNTAPCAWWVLYHIFSDAQLLDEIRHELSAAVYEDENHVWHVDMARLLAACPLLLGTFQETMRYHAVNPGPRVILKDVVLNDGTLLKKGSILMIPTTVQHTDTTAWGDDADQFDHLRFSRTAGANGRKKPNRIAFRPFGGGQFLCPGRHFASNEILAVTALAVLQFEVVPVGGKWVEPTVENSPPQSAFPLPDEDIQVEFRPRDPKKAWDVTFSGVDQPMGIVSEDAVADS
ncbi:cytochrome P450 oxidoreductase [Apiospora rasikravindrae]|uniref:Cytochrome P450 oxidoreductase n=1 Tax=Apiospora rasikravindrae TaxID=990691 RepID=A0ABR1TYW7_9PEZI